MKYLNTFTAATLIAASSSVFAADLRDNMVISAGSYVELGVMAGIIAGDQTPVAQTGGNGKFTQQPWSVQRSMHMPQRIEIVGDKHAEPKENL
jgi:hypothetical protein